MQKKKRGNRTDHGKKEKKSNSNAVPIEKNFAFIISFLKHNKMPKIENIRQIEIYIKT